MTIQKAGMLFTIATFLLLIGWSTRASAAAPLSGTGTASVMTSVAVAVTPDAAVLGGIVNRPVVTTGCGKAAPASQGTTLDATLTSDGLQRAYRLHIPIGYTPNQKMPLVVNFHGMNETDQEQELYTRYSALANQHHFLVVYPQGVTGSDGKVGWATYGKFDPTVNDVLFVSDLLTTLQHQLCIDPLRIYVTGMSNGGGMTNLLACQMSGRLAAFAAVSAAIYPIPGGCHPARPVPYLEFHGTADPIVHYTGSTALTFPPVMQTMQDWATLNGCTTGPTTFFQQADVTGLQWAHCRNGVIVQHYRVEDGGHTWPGASPIPRLGSTTQTIDATTLGWQFMQQYHLL